MLNNYEFWTLTGIGALALGLSGVNMYLSQTNAGLQAEASGRAQYIQQSVALENLYREIVQALADRAIRTRDTQIRDLLAAEGLNVNFDTAPPPAAAQSDKK
jgi:hypothetical protein